ncbi:MAG TPA: TrbI/VirB10 family protein [Candidatus Acidoferrales bacterium]|nr:TrbI/VirB10 family protein [Candidatus Acidoferrales bacterium]
MTEPTTAPAAAPIQDKAPKPPGLMPKNVQAWVMLGLAVLMIVIMWTTGGKRTQPAAKSNVSTFQPSAQPEVNETQIAALQNRIQELQREQQTAITQQNKFFGSLQSGPQPAASAQVTGEAPQPPPSDPVQEERKRRAYVSLFSSNVALSYRKELAPSQQSSPTAQARNEAPGPSNLPAQPLDMNQLAQILAQIPPQPPLAGVPTAALQPRNQQPGNTTAEKEEKLAPETSSASNPLDDASGKTYVLFEGTILETVLLNRLDGDFAGPIECLITNDIYSHDRQHLLIPSGTKVLGEAKRVDTFGQTRLAVVFHRLIMPDGYSVSLDQFKGMNQIGDTGLHDKVNNHYFKIFGASLAVGAIGGIAQAGSGGVLTQSGTQSIQQGVGESMGQTSQRILDKFLNILPTVTIREGHRVKIYLSGDLALPDYANHKIPPNL